MVLRQPGPAEADHLRAALRPVPVPGAGEVLLKVQACGVCHTDLHLVEGEIDAPRLPIVPGHQVVATVEKGGPGTARFAAGTRVGVAWLHHACGVCAACRRGDENLCDAARFTGYHVDGGYAEYLVAPEAFVHPLPEAFDAVTAAPLLCAGIIGHRALRLSGAAAGERVALFGFGASAHLTLQMARWRGCVVDVFSRSQEHRRLALSLGAAWAGQAGETPPAMADRAILFAPAGRLIPAALSILRPGGTLVIAVIHLDVVPEMDYSLIFQERVVRTVTASTRRDGGEFLRDAAAAGIRVEAEAFPLDEAGRVLGLLKSGRLRAAGVLVP
jgi:propanol-preferring alcohol dehydrogenase